MTALWVVLGIVVVGLTLRADKQRVAKRKANLTPEQLAREAEQVAAARKHIAEIPLRRAQRQHARSVRRHFYTATFWGGRGAGERDRRFREAYPTRQARRAARRKGWGFPS